MVYVIGLCVLFLWFFFKGFVMTVISKTETKRRERVNRNIFPDALIDSYDGLCECCKREKTRGECFEDKDFVFVCNYCWWTRER